MRRLRRLAALGLLLVATSALAIANGCAAPELGDMPARCSEADPSCPDGLTCIHDVCAKPGTAVPITIARLGNLRGVDLRLVPQAKSALVTWETYAYSDEGQGFVGARVDGSGHVSATMTLVSSFAADPGALEPYYDVLATSDTDLLVAVSASPLPDDDSPASRLLTYRVHLPPEGQETTAPSFQAAWDDELRMATIGYGAVSRPKLVKSGDGVALGYFRSLTETVAGEPKTAGELAVLSLAKDGSLLSPDPKLYPARDGLTVAVGVVDALAAGDDLWWVLDDERPSLLRTSASGEAVEAKLERLGVPLTATATEVSYLEPSKRAGEGLPDDPVSGPSTLRRLTIASDGAGGGGGGASAPDVTDDVVAELSSVRDTPRPVLIERAGKPAILVSPGADLSASAIGVYLLDTKAGTLTESAKVERLATTEIGGLGAVLVGTKLFVAWVDTTSDANVIRMAVLPEP